MDKFNIAVGTKEYEFAIDKYKIFFGPNYNLKYSIRNRFKQRIENVENSEYQEYKKRFEFVKFNDKDIHHKNWEVIEINPSFTLANDLKMSAKSLFLRYAETALFEVKCFDEINTISNLIKVVCESVNENISLENGIVVKFESNDFTFKSLVKNLYANILNDDLIINEYDISFEEVILLQMHIIEKIANSELNKTKFFLNIIDLPQITSKILAELDNINSENVKTLVFTNSIHPTLEIENYVYCSKQFTDIYFEEQILDNIIYETTTVSEIIDAKTELKNIISGKSTEKSSIISEIL